KLVLAQDGGTGLRLAKERRPTGIILDVKLPDMDGWRVMEALRADRRTATVPVHFVSALDAAERGMAMGAVGDLVKPATAKDLAMVVESLAPRSADRAGPILVVEPEADAGESLVAQLAREKFEAERVGSAREAELAFGAKRFACMVLDLSLPDMDGLALLESMQTRGAEAPPVVVYTARALSKGEVQKLEAYAEAIVIKEGSSVERLLDEIRIFARRLKEGLGPRRASSGGSPRLHPASVHLEG